MSKEKRRVPKLRFPGFTEDWEQRKLGECIDISTGYPFDSQDFNENGEYLVITNGNIQENTPFVLNNVGNRIDLDDSLKKYILDIDDLLITMDGTVGRVAIVVNNKLVLAQRVCRIKSNEPYYIYQLLSKNNFIQSMNKIGHGGTIKHISLSEISEYQDFYPKSQKERIKISTVLTNCDKLITLHQRKLNNLKLKRKALLQKLFPKNGEGYPELRFPGFTDAWEQRKLGEIFEYLQNNTLSRDSLNYKIPNIKNIHYGDILVKFNEILDGSNKDIPYINPDLDLSKFSKSLLRDGDVIFSDTAEDDTVGKAIELQNVNAPFILSGLHTIPCRPLIPFGKGYLGNFFNSNSYRLQIRPLVQGIKVSSISKSALKDTMIKYPKNLDEQEKIGSLFQSITKMITLHQRKLKHLQIQKKSLLQKLFV
ncbi:restriction endonuclease subunit S [Veillonella parvula]|nr:restriction endonuclease subunit S [Veillonella parvula]EFB85356.1 type I restriction modification DNA specificity domain protein [Veillonella parvula ATCC 17745]